MTLLGVALDRTPLTEIECLNCGDPLAIHQPDEGFPERMLGACEQCRDWFLWDFDAGTNEAVLVLLPDRDHFKRAAGGTGP